MARKAALQATVLLLVLLGAAGCDGPPPGAEGEEKSSETQPVPVETITVATGTASETILATTTLKARRQVVLLAGAMGHLAELSVDEGDSVLTDVSLGRVHNPELSLAVDRARSQVRRAKVEVDRLRPLLEKGFIPRAEFDRAETQWQIAREEQRRASAGSKDTVVKSPIDGVVAMRHVEVGTQLTPNQPVLTIVDPADLIAELPIPERELGKLALQQKATVHSEALGEQRFPALLENIAPTVDPTSGTIKVTLAITELEAAGQRLRPGMFVEARIVTATRTDVPLVPKRALLHDETRPFVVVAQESAAKVRWLELGVAEGANVEVLSGLVAGDEVVVLGQAGIKENAPLKIIRRDGALVEQPPTPDDVE